ncbi:hypothetical protein Asppvi_003438 [Aspergillus pseudoviridinutans]|uniref:Uncharacterized protein n=1 Tax=Aspergillus pseudoviridinutans TaxID=1517512 RepID=A0A9P3BBC0_9EURO|nr:uncharacterized protein Asppvi_003438 [Aspergillus pseudoviridinutans]GIJ84591.1 hypothetical protein Asppvi_003438 [Aspergillus pseudoviridinutans]
MDYLVKQGDGNMRHVPYGNVINSVGKEELIEALLNGICPEIRELKGKKITAKELEGIREKQLTDGADPWRNNSGYLDFVLDDRNPDYWRAYVGQSNNPMLRISQHIRNIRDRKRDSLHYYIIWKGGHFRSANFIRLWSIPYIAIDSPEIQLIAQNILEVGMCYAFHSLPPATLERIFGLVVDNPYKGMGLNVVSPLLQGSNLRVEARHHFSRQVAASSDPEIRNWPAFRAKERAKEEENEKEGRAFRKPPKQMMKLEDINHALASVIAAKPELSHLQPPDFKERAPRETRDNQQVDLRRMKAITAVKVYNDLELDEIPAMIPPNGNVNAHIGIVLDHILPGRNKEDSIFSLLPWGIKESGFNQANCLIWVHNLRLYDVSSLLRERIRSISAKEFEILRKFNHELIKESQLKVIIMCGSFDKTILVPEDAPKVSVNLEGFSFDMFLEHDGQCVTRIYACSPPALPALLEDKWREARKISLLFRFAALITGTPGIWPGFQNAAITCTQIVRLAYDDGIARAEGRPATTVDSLSPSLRFWLATKGFQKDEDILRLQAKSSLADALLMVMCLLQCRPSDIKGTFRKKAVTASTTRRREIYTKEQLDHVKSLLVELNPKWFPDHTYRKKMQYTGKYEIEADNPNAHLDAAKATKATEDAQLEEVNPLDEPLSDGPQEDASTKAAKGATVKQVLQAEMDLDEDPDVISEEIVTDDPNGYLELTEDQLEEAVKPINQVLSDDPQGDAATKAAKEAKVKRVLQVETDLAEDPDALLEMDDETLEKAREISYGVPFQVLSQKRPPADKELVPVYTTRMELLHGGRLYKGRKRYRNTFTATLPMGVVAAIKAQPGERDAKHDLLVRAELKPPGERHPNLWATQALPSDPGARVGITVTRTEGDRTITTYATNDGPWAPYKANSFVDWLTGVEYIHIAQKPRRYLHFQRKLQKNLPEELQYFAGGGYIGDKGGRFKNSEKNTHSARVALNQHLPQATSSLPDYDPDSDFQDEDSEEDLEV